MRGRNAQKKSGVIAPEQDRTSETSPIKFDAEGEIRFAVVMYGGVSLAIYINGVAQELLSLVRATAPKSAGSQDLLLGDNQLKGAEKVYREVGQYLVCGWPTPEQPAPTERRVRTRFIVDVISGTSAGGINGVFLAKALARNQTMEGLKNLWLQEGDLGKLLNDPRALQDLASTGITQQSPPLSLLNSRRMYRKLLEALAEMGKKGEAPGPSPLVSELDLFVTATDIEGVPLPISLADEVIYERRYKNVFHFRYADELTSGIGRDDFKKNNDPFLAFAARCTSSFPFAFEAMCLNDIDEILNHYELYKNDKPKEAADWDAFFKDYLRLGYYDIDKNARGLDPTGLPADAPTVEEAGARLRKRFRTRSFGDGGYLDNKPFSHATSMLMRRYADAIVSRKLLYVEPTPEHPEFAPEKRDRPDFVQNIAAAALDLPRQETIREDLDRVDERNRMLKRAGLFSLHADDDFGMAKADEPLSRATFASHDLQDMIERYGVSYGAYHRLSVEETTNLLAEVIARALGYDTLSDAAQAIRELTIAWRLRRYDEIKVEGRPTENEFLTTFNIRFRLRRLIFLMRRVNQMGKPVFDDELRDMLRTWLKREKAQVLKRSSQKDPAWKVMTDMQENWFSRQKTPPVSWLGDFREELKQIKAKKLAAAVTAVRVAEEQFGDPKSTASEDLAKLIDKLNLPWTELAALISEDEDFKEQALARIFKDREQAFQDVANYFATAWQDKQFTSPELLDPAVDVDLLDGKVAARRCLQHYCANFNVYDLVTYPVVYGTGAGEANVVDVFRVSPDDATALVEQRRSGRRKLAGTYLMSFGAFLDEKWRKNDMLWGRLDGAERIISALLPKHDEETQKLRADLIKQAQMSILEEESKPNGLIEPNPQLNTREKLWQFYKDEFQVPQDLALYVKLGLGFRGTNVSGNMFAGLSGQHHFAPGRRIAASIAWLGAAGYAISTLAFKLAAIFRGIFGTSKSPMRK